MKLTDDEFREALLANRRLIKEIVGPNNHVKAKDPDAGLELLDESNLDFLAWAVSNDSNSNGDIRTALNYYLAKGFESEKQKSLEEYKPSDFNPKTI